MFAKSSRFGRALALARPNRRDRLTTAARVGLTVLGCLLLVGCGLTKTENTYPEQLPGKKGHTAPGGQAQGGLFGPEGLTLFGGSNDQPQQQGPGLGVNSFLWRASLDSISFMPLVSADPFGGVIITDWYAPPEVQNERFKITVYILGRDLRADGVRAVVFRQVRDDSGEWTDAAVEPQTPIDLENAILTRARQLRIAGLQ